MRLNFKHGRKIQSSSEPNHSTGREEKIAFRQACGNRHNRVFVPHLTFDGDGVPQNRSPELMTPAALQCGGAFCDPPQRGFFRAGLSADLPTRILQVLHGRKERLMNNIWFQSALWMALALIAATASIYITISAALFEIVVGAMALTFLAGTDIDPHVVKRNFASSVTIGLMGFFAPYLGCLLLAHYGLGWPWPQAQIGGIALSTTSVAVVYAVMVETGYNQTELG